MPGAVLSTEHGLERAPICKDRGRQTFLVKGQIINISAFVGHSVSVALAYKQSNRQYVHE